MNYEGGHACCARHDRASSALLDLESYGFQISADPVHRCSSPNSGVQWSRHSQVVARTTRMVSFQATYTIGLPLRRGS